MIFVRICFVLIFITLFATVLVLDNHLTGKSPWHNFESSTKQRIDGIPFCEYDRSTSLLRERSNSLSDFAFLAVGFYMLVQAIEGQQKTRAKNTILSLINGLANCAHAIGSWLNHACRCQLGHRLDLTGMWLIIAFISFYSLIRHANIKTFLFTLIFMVNGFILWIMSDIYYPQSYDNEEKILTTILIVIFALSECFHLRSKSITAKQLKWFGLGALSLIIGVVSGQLDASKIVCWPHSWFQLHAVWHMCAACSVLAIYEYFRADTSFISKKIEHLT
ncbi:unnamed protein product [Adineta ricciae]|uniref:Alkaline ceramidase n=1 Tax=Adineta ricciae TaxID=249248 RepID=A0A813PAD1_ADIRI|nr:unnamed protein product [Adineta ricciae]CAF1191378.1 unnamed protein product [Adineta ricciae]